MSSKHLVLALFALCGCTHSTLLVADDEHAVFDTVEAAPFSERVFSFTNDGSDTTSPLAVQLSGDVHAFHIVDDGCSGVALKSGAHCSVTVHLASDDAGAFSGELRVTSTTANAAILLDGKVTPAQLVVTAQPSGAIEAVQGQMVTGSLTVGNRGGATTGALQIGAQALGFFDVGDDCTGKALAGGDSCKVTLSRAVPSDAALGSFAGALDVSAVPGGAVSTPVSLVVHVGGKLVVEDFDWGVVPTLGMVQRDIQISNPGPVASGPVTAMISASDPTEPFHILSQKCGELKVGASCFVTVVANLTDAASHTATLAVSANFVGPGSGKIRVGGIDYGNAPPGTVLAFPNKQGTSAITALPASGSTFAGWSGTAPCSGTGVCTIVGPDNSDLTLTATFTQ
ncbi:MAG: hypothetical protein ACXVCV_04830 [Polyangia bacterium]